MRGVLAAAARLDQTKFNNWWMALRNAIAVAVPLAIGAAIQQPLAAVAVATGALNVAYSDDDDPYQQRAKRMLIWSSLGGLAVFIGSVNGNYHVMAVLTTAAWAFIAGLLVSVSTRAGDLGLNTLVTVIVFAARGAMSPKGALAAGLLVFGGGLAQTVMALLLWPLRRYAPERRAIAKAYLDLSENVHPQSEKVESAPLTQIPSKVQDAVAAVGRDHSSEGERLRLLFDQVDRLRLSIYLVARLRAELRGEELQSSVDEPASASELDHVLELASSLLHCVGQTLISGATVSESPTLLSELESIVDRAQQEKENPKAPLASEIAAALDVMAGQLRVTVQLARSTTIAGLEELARGEEAAPWSLRDTGWLATLRANLDWRSAACRHAVRLAIAVAAGNAIARSLAWEREYWIPMTIAVVLKPDFTTTFSRGVLRLLGTLAGLLLATLLYHLLPYNALTQLLLVGVFAYFLRWAGPGNYGIFSVCISGLIVFLIAATGVPPGEVVFERAVNTLAGGLLALVAYALWPTWEKATVSEAIAGMLDATREYFRQVIERFGRDDVIESAALTRKRDEWRRVRTAAEASVDRVAAEPGFEKHKLDLLNSILASSHELMHSIMGLELGVLRAPSVQSIKALAVYAHDVEFTLYYAAEALRHSRAAGEMLPKLRESYRRMVETRQDFSPADQFVILECDRITVALNTLREQVERYVTGVNAERPYLSLARGLGLS
ncbi:MAG: FUSC family protein [Acidobacteriaceae bacterium]|nr:FUSC family protein [Acidobacteriaceae bacterium]